MVVDSIHSSIPLSLLFLPPLLSFWAARVFFPQGYQCPCPWVTYLFGVELATPPCKKPLQLPPVLGVEVGLGAIGVGKPVAMALIWVCWGRPTMQTPQVPTNMTDACGIPVPREGQEDPFALFLTLGILVGLQMWCLPLRPFLG